MQANCPPESGGQRHRVLCDDARGGSPNEMFKNAFLKSAALEPPPARSRLLSRSCCPPDSGGQFVGFDTSNVPQCLRLRPILREQSKLLYDIQDPIDANALQNCLSGSIPVRRPGSVLQQQQNDLS